MPTFERDLRVIDEIVIETGQYLREDFRAVDISRLLLRSVYWLSVAVWHILDWTLRKEKNND